MDKSNSEDLYSLAILVLNPVSLLLRMINKECSEPYEKYSFLIKHKLN